MTSALSRITTQSDVRRFRARVVIIGLLIILVVVFEARAADVARIGVVDFQRVLRESLAGKAAANTLRQKQDERSADLKKRRQEIVNLQAALERMELLADPSDREQKKLELTLKLDAFNEADAMYAGQLKEINTKQTAEIRQAVSGVVDAIGKKGGYLLILEKNDTVYAPASTDITVQVIEAYNKQYTGNQ